MKRVRWERVRKKGKFTKGERVRKVQLASTPVSQLTTYSVSQPVNYPASQSVNHPVSQPPSQSVSQSVNHPASQKVCSKTVLCAPKNAGLPVYHKATIRRHIRKGIYLMV